MANAMRCGLFMPGLCSSFGWSSRTCGGDRIGDRVAVAATRLLLGMLVPYAQRSGCSCLVAECTRTGVRLPGCGSSSSRRCSDVRRSGDGAGGVETAGLRTRSPNILSSHWLSAARFSSGTTAACSIFAAVAADTCEGLTSREVGREAGREAGRDPGREAVRDVGRLPALSTLPRRDAAAMGGPLGFVLRASSAARRASGLSPSSGSYLCTRFNHRPKHVQCSGKSALAT